MWLLICSLSILHLSVGITFSTIQTGAWAEHRVAQATRNREERWLIMILKN